MPHPAILVEAYLYLTGITAVVLLAVTGCGSKQDEWLTVTDDPAAIAEARRMADRLRGEEIAALLANLDASLLDTVACIASGFGIRARRSLSISEGDQRLLISV
jgi:hypothetical protein